jgi:integrase
VHRNNFPTWRNRKHAAHWISTLETYVLPTLGDMKIDTIRKRVVLFRLTPIWAAKPETARRVRQGMRSVFSWGKAHDYIKYNVAGEAINAALPAMPKIKAHYRSLPYQDVPAALSAIEEARASKSAKLCLRFVVLTACRSGEARLATWDEIDREAEVWTVPSHRMKAGREHRVPLSGLALSVVDEAATIADGSDLLCQGRRNNMPARCRC